MKRKRQPRLKVIPWSPAAENKLLVCMAETREVVRQISDQLDELELFIRAFYVLESKQALLRWFHTVVPALGAKPIDLCNAPSGRAAILRELGRIEDEVHSRKRKQELN